MKELRKKKIIFILLLLSCVMSGYLFFKVADDRGKRLRSFAQADSLITGELTDFQIAPGKVSSESVYVDSAFSRKVYHVEVPDHLSKTQFHSRLNRTLYEYSIETPGRVIFPEKNLRIHLLFHDTIVRTLVLKDSKEE